MVWWLILFQCGSYWIQPSSSGRATTELTLHLPTSTAQTSSAALSADDYQKEWEVWTFSTAQNNMQAEATLANPLEELNDYLNSPLVDFRDKKLDIVVWWGVSHVVLPLHSPLLIPACLPSATRSPLSNPRPRSSRLSRYSRLSRQM
jgi:hypothetical protein